MDAVEVARWITATLDGVESTEANGDTFYFAGSEPADQRMPFATNRDQRLQRHCVEPLEAGRLPREPRRQPRVLHRALRAASTGPITAEPVDTGHDYTALDVLMPHPIYASLSWISVVQPSAETLRALQPLLTEAYAIAASRRARRQSASGEADGSLSR